MNLTLGTLDELKAHLLNEALQDDTRFDATIAALGLGVAGEFERLCARRFGRVVGATFEASADRDHYTLPRYPVEAVTKIELRQTLAEGWVDQGDVDGLVRQIMAEAGLVLLDALLGGWADRVRLTYTGGYWIDESADGTIDHRSAVQQGSVSLSANDETKAISFGVAFASAPKVALSLVAPAGGVIISVQPSAITTSGCTALLAAPIPDAGYSLQWIAVAANATGSGGALPEGATELPHELKVAWFLQCEHIWRLRDKLGTSVAESARTAADMAALTSLQVLPSVQAILASHRRFALT